MASNVSDSCRVWDVQIDKTEEAKEVIGHLGDIEHLRAWLGEGETLQAGQVVWITDTTPHESLPMKSDTYRQFFRLVIGEVAIWYAHHSTANRLGIVPSSNTRIISN